MLQCITRAFLGFEAFSLDRQAALCAVAMAGIGLAAQPALAQGERARPASAANARLSIDRFDLAGAGCPQLSSTAIFAQQAEDRLLVRIDFERNPARRTRERFFEVSGDDNRVRACTARLRLAVEADRAVDVELDRALQQVQFLTRSEERQLIVRSQFRLNNELSNVRAFRFVNPPGARLVAVNGDGPQRGRQAEVVLDRLSLRSRAAQVVELRSTVQLQLAGREPGLVERILGNDGGPIDALLDPDDGVLADLLNDDDDGLLRLRNLALELRLVPVADALAEDPINDPLVPEVPVSQPPVNPAPPAPDLDPAPPMSPMGGGDGGGEPPVDRRGFPTP